MELSTQMGNKRGRGKAGLPARSVRVASMSTHMRANGGGWEEGEGLFLRGTRFS